MVMSNELNSDHKWLMESLSGMDLSKFSLRRITLLTLVETEGDLDIGSSSVCSVHWRDPQDDLASEADSTESRLGSSRRGSTENLLEPTTVNLSRHSSSNGRYAPFSFVASAKDGIFSFYKPKSGTSYRTSSLYRNRSR